MLTADPSWALEAKKLRAEQAGVVRLHVKQVLASHAFAGSKRIQDFLQLIIGHALDGDFDKLRERMIGA
jgi:hypothetical protein